MLASLRRARVTSNAIELSIRLDPYLFPRVACDLSLLNCFCCSQQCYNEDHNDSDIAETYSCPSDTLTTSFPRYLQFLLVTSNRRSNHCCNTNYHHQVSDNDRHEKPWSFFCRRKQHLKTFKGHIRGSTSFSLRRPLEIITQRRGNETTGDRSACRLQFPVSNSAALLAINDELELCKTHYPVVLGSPSALIGGMGWHQTLFVPSDPQYAASRM